MTDLAREQWRVSWEMWPHEWPAPHGAEKVYDDEAEARRHLEGLVSMEAPHGPQPCSKHVWNIRFERRQMGDWQEAST